MRQEYDALLHISTLTNSWDLFHLNCCKSHID